MQRRTKGHEEGWLLSYADLITNLLLFFVLMMSASSVSRSRFQRIAKSVSGQEAASSLESIKEEIDSAIKQRGIEEVVSTSLSDEGLSLSLNSGLVFGSGSATIRPEWDATVAAMLAALVPYSQNYNFAVEGHTDAIPVAAGSPFASNWELSSARAIALRQRLEDVGVVRDHIRVEGYADTKPLPPESLEGLSEGEQLARHRRVVVRVY